MTQALAVNGASKVFIIGRRLEALQETETGGPEGTIIPIQGDITSKESLQAAYEAVSSQTGHVDLLIANSGIVEPNPQTLFHPPTSPSPSRHLGDPREALVHPDGGLLTCLPEFNGLVLYRHGFLPLLDSRLRLRLLARFHHQDLKSSSPRRLLHGIVGCIRVFHISSPRLLLRRWSSCSHRLLRRTTSGLTVLRRVSMHLTS